MSSAAGRPGPGKRKAGNPGNANALGIIAGSGAIPYRVAAAATAGGRDVFVFAIKGHAGKDLETFPHTWISLGEVGRFLSTIEQRGCSEVVITGGVERPTVADLKLDFGGVKRLPRIAATLIGGDDRVLGGIIRMIEENSVRVVGVHEVAPDLVLAPGHATRRKPSKKLADDITTGRRLISALGPFDVGQSVVIDQGRVLAIEAVEGTDAMLARCAEWRSRHKGGPSGVLVKGAKPGQELRVDLPTIGEQTVEGASRAGLLGIAAQAGKTLVPDLKSMVSQANKHRLFVYGFDGDKEE